MERKVTMIPPTINPQTHLPKTQKVKRKVAGYARVSTDFEEQLTSYAAQVDYYTKYIQKREDWEFVGANRLSSVLAGAIPFGRTG